MIAEFSPLGDAVLDGLLSAGHEIVEVWYGSSASLAEERLTPRQLRRRARGVARLKKTRPLTFRNLAGTSHADRLALLDEVGNPPVLVSAGSSIIFKQDFLDRFAVAVNFHPTLLPHYRGPFPLEALVIRGDADRYGGMTMHELNAGIDEGAIVAQRAIPRSSARNSLDWRYRLARAAGEMAARDLGLFIEGQITPVPQAAGSGSYVRLSQDEHWINESWTFELAQRVLEETGRIGPKLVANPGGLRTGFHVSGPARRLGPPTGAPLRIGRSTLEFDLVDARVALTRDRRLQRWHRRVLRAVDRFKHGH